MLKLILTILTLLNGGFMLIDGIHVMLKGKYIGPELPGPWAKIFQVFHINVFKLGPLFILFGCFWLLFLFAFWFNQQWAYMLGISISILTLWYIPVGSLVSVIVLLLLLFARTKLGI